MLATKLKSYFSATLGSDEELDDLKAAYISCKGDMDDILDTVMCSDIEDVPRFKKIIKKWIKDGEVESFKAFAKDNKEKQKARKKKVR